MFGTGIVVAIRRRLAALRPQERSATPPDASHGQVLSSAGVRGQSEAERGEAGNRRLQSLFFQVCERLKPSVFLEVGANDGYASRAVRQRLSGCDIHAFEANPEIHSRVAPRLEAAQVRTWNLAVSNVSGPTTIYAPLQLSQAYQDGRIVPAIVNETPDTGKTSLLLRDEDATYREFKVEATTLDDFAAVHLGSGGERRVVLWIDVEGAADKVIAGAANILEQSLAIFIEMEGFQFWEGQTDRSVLLDSLAFHGFIAVARDREYGDLQYNVIFVHQSAVGGLFPIAIDGVSGLCFAPFGKAELRTPTVVVIGADIPVLIPTFNAVTYVRDMVLQLRERGVRDIRIIDNGSTYGPMIEFLADPGGGVTVLRLEHNKGPHHVLKERELFNELPDVFCLTDPDLIFNPDMPADFMAQLLDMTERLAIGKAGLALDISEPTKLRQELFVIGDQKWRIWDWEAQFWATLIGSSREGDPAYDANIDTTFALYNKKFFDSEKYLVGVRIAGRFTCRHRPWYPDSGLPPAEEEYYRMSARDSFYFRKAT